jgi:hypothetical protein
MEKLRKLVHELSQKDFEKLETMLVENRSEKFLFLLQAFRSKSIIKDKDLLEKLHCNENALYVLKSRLYEKIQKHLVKEVPQPLPGDGNPGQSPTQLVFEQPRETAIAILLQLEKKYIENDVPGELIEIYSALKKAHYNSDKYYVYSQLYNKHVAFTAAVEKAEDTLYNFNKTLSNYFFSRSETDLDLIRLLRSEMKNIFALNQSHRIELIKNFISIQVQLFTPFESNLEESLEDLLTNSERIISGFPNDKQLVYYKKVLDFFRFEYYQKIREPRKAAHYFELVNEVGSSWLLMSPVCQAHRFLISKVCFLTRNNRTSELHEQDSVPVDNYDFYTEVVIRLYRALVKFYTGQVKEGAIILNELLNEASFKDFFHMEVEIKLTLAYMYTRLGEFELAENLSKSISRKLSDKKETYGHAKAFLKILNLLMDNDQTAGSRKKVRNALDHFVIQNQTQQKILEFLQADLETLNTSLA